MSKVSTLKQELKLKEWSRIYQKFLESGKTVKEWRGENVISVKTFYYILRKIRELTIEKHKIVPVSCAAASIHTNQHEKLLVQNVIRITAELPSDISAETLIKKHVRREKRTKAEITEKLQHIEKIVEIENAK